MPLRRGQPHGRKPRLSGHKAKRSLSYLSDPRLRSCCDQLASARARFLSGFNLPVTLKSVCVWSFPIHRSGYFWSQSIRPHNRIRECFPVLLWAAAFLSLSPGLNWTWHQYFAHGVNDSWHWFNMRLLFASWFHSPKAKKPIKPSCPIKI